MLELTIRHCSYPKRLRLTVFTARTVTVISKVAAVPAPVGLIVNVLQ